jgi:hypothetical protein
MVSVPLNRLVPDVNRWFPEDDPSGRQTAVAL